MEIISLLLDVDIIFSEEDGVTSQVVNLSNEKTVMTFILGFGNQIFKEIRAVGQTEMATRKFIEILMMGGFGGCKNPPLIGRELYREGDICFPKEDSFVFVSPMTKSSTSVEVKDFNIT